MSIENQIKVVREADTSEGLLNAVKELAASCHHAAIPTLIEVLGYNNPGAAVAAVEGLIQLGEVTVPYILKQLDSYNYGARAWAVRALAGIGDHRALALLLDSVEHDFSPSVRRSAAKGLGNLSWSQFAADEVSQKEQLVLDSLLKASQESEWVVRYAAIVGLESLALSVSQTSPSSGLKQEILQHLKNRLDLEMDSTVQARIKLIRERIS